MVLGIVWIFWLGSILAVIFGHVALSQIKRSMGTLSGRGMAIAGLVLGYVGIAVLIATIAAAAIVGPTTATAAECALDRALLSSEERAYFEDEGHYTDVRGLEEAGTGRTTPTCTPSRSTVTRRTRPATPSSTKIAATERPTMQDVHDKVAVITGGASGMGRAFADRFAAEGMKLVLADIEEPELARAVDELKAAGAEAIGVRTDVARIEDVQALAGTGAARRSARCTSSATTRGSPAGR